MSTRSKHGTTWLQTILLLLVHGPVDRWPGPLWELSPWVDHLVEPIPAVVSRVSAQERRRVLKTHTPLDGVPTVPGVWRIVVARDPLDAAVSLYHQGSNLDRERLAELSGSPTSISGRAPLEEWLAAWVDEVADPRARLDSLDGVLHHLTDAWGRRGDDDVVLLRYADLLTDLDEQMALLANRLGFGGPDAYGDGWPLLVEAASFTAMRSRADHLAPDAGGVLRDPSAFFRRGLTGSGEAAVPSPVMDRYRERLSMSLPADLQAWLAGSA